MVIAGKAARLRAVGGGAGIERQRDLGHRHRRALRVFDRESRSTAAYG